MSDTKRGRCGIGRKGFFVLDKSFFFFPIFFGRLGSLSEPKKKNKGEVGGRMMMKERKEMFSSDSLAKKRQQQKAVFFPL